MTGILANSTRTPSWDRLEVIEVPIAALSAAPKHARRHPAAQIRALARSIETFGFNAPVVVDEANRLLSGHARIEAVKRLGWDSVPAIRVSDLTEAEKRAFVLADNRLAERAIWDEALLAENFQILDDLDLEFPLEATGFETSEIDRLLGFEIVDAADAADNPVEPVDGPAVSQVGDCWELGPHRLFCGNALDRGSYDKLMGGGRARMILTDPPYNLAARDIGRSAARRHGDFVSGAGELDNAGFVDFLVTMFRHARSVSVDGALVYAFMDWKHARHILEAGQEVFDGLKNICVWDKGTGGMGSLYRSQHELIFVFKAGRTAHVNNVELGRNGRNRTNVWRHSGANGLAGLIEDASRSETLAVHPTVKPTRLLADAILDVTRRSEIVLDPFLGSGSTLMGCERVGRRCFGVELDPRYADATLRRWRSYTGEEPVNVGTGLTLHVCEARVEEAASASKTRRSSNEQR